jgi:hypothetical protein
MTATAFKERYIYRNHNRSFNLKKYSNNTELSTYIRKLTENKQDFEITAWSILSKTCCFLYGRIKNIVFRVKTLSTCNHKKKFLVNNDNIGRNACIQFYAHVSDRNHLSSPLFKICQPHNDIHAVEVYTE